MKEGSEGREEMGRGGKGEVEKVKAHLSSSRRSTVPSTLCQSSLPFLVVLCSVGVELVGCCCSSCN